MTSIGKRNWFFAFSLALTIPGIIFILLGPLTGGQAGLQFSIDYTGGTKWEIRFDDRSVTPDQVKAVLVAEGYGDSTVQTTSNDFLLIRTEPIGFVDDAGPQHPGPAPPRAAPSAPRPRRPPAPPPPPVRQPRSARPAPRPAPRPPRAAPRRRRRVLATPGPSFPASLPAGLVHPADAGPARPGHAHGRDRRAGHGPRGELGPIESQRQLTTIGPVISAELTQQAIILVLIGSIGILLWMTFRFRDFRFGATALVALLHDVIVVVGAFAILGTLFGLEVDGLFVTAMLTIIGFSVHDTIVVYDRIRENRSRHAGERFSSIVNHSILQTLARSINTSLVVDPHPAALFLFGGDSIRPFILALLIGITSGTYSSIFNAAPLLTVWEEWEARRKERATPGRPVRRASA